MNKATMRPTRHKGHRLKLHEKTLKTLGSGNMLDAVTIPPGEDESEWLVGIGMLLRCCMAASHARVASLQPIFGP